MRKTLLLVRKTLLLAALALLPLVALAQWC